MAIIKSQTIHLVLNTGHHYSFFPLSLFPQSGANVNRLCSNDDHKWEELSGKPWCRYCFGTKNGQNGVYICIDTNCGSTQRGTVESSKPTTIDEKKWKEETASFSSPYIVSGKQEPDKAIEILGTTIKLEWDNNAGSHRPVDLIVDFGNSRTTVLALENKGSAEETLLSKFCYPIVFLNRREEFDGLTDRENSGDDLSRMVVDSWFVLRQHEFGDLETQKKCASYDRSIEKKTRPKKILGITVGEEPYEVHHYFREEHYPQQFVEISPSIMGNEAAECLANASPKCEGFFMSSPKRYIWDNEKISPSKLAWQMLPNSEVAQNTKPLGGQICRYIFDNGKDWEFKKPPFLYEKAYGATANPQEPRFPRRETMVWSALSIIEMAYREINSTAWREGNNLQIRRHLNSIAVTYPSGWIGEEKKAFEDAWNRAANIFAHAHYENPEVDRPKIILEIDEAVASQMPYVFSKINDAESDEERNKVDVWIDSEGQEHNIDEDGTAIPSVRLMTIDIGGGTLDASIVEYTSMFRGNSNLPGGYVNHKLLFCDSNNHAGDDALKNVVENVLMPSIFDEIFGFDSAKAEEEAQKRFRNYFYKVCARASDEAVRSRITKILLLPIAQYWLSLLGIGGSDDRDVSVADIVGVNAENIIDEFNEEIRKEFNKEIGWQGLRSSVHLAFKKEEIEKCIIDALTPGIKVLEPIASKYDVDKIVLSGKITEIPIVKEICLNELNVPVHRIREMIDFPAGEWYPMNQNGNIRDAKTVTVVGAALHRAFSLGLIAKWKFNDVKDSKTQANDNYWGVIDENPNKGGFVGRPLLNPGEDYYSGIASIGSRIGRMSTNSRVCRPQQEYILDWEDGEAPNNDSKWQDPIQLEIVRLRENGNESLEVRANSCKTSDGEPLPKPIKLKHNTLDGVAFWADIGRFDINFKKTNKKFEE